MAVPSGSVGAETWDIARRGGPRHIRARRVPARIVTGTGRTTEDAALANLAADPGAAARQLTVGIDGPGHANPDATWHSTIKDVLLITGTPLPHNLGALRHALLRGRPPVRRAAPARRLAKHQHSGQLQVVPGARGHLLTAG